MLQQVTAPRCQGPRGGDAGEPERQEREASLRELREGREVVGAAVRTRAGVRPLYVSVGHRISFETAVEVVLASAPRFRSPEPLRAAHRLAFGAPSSGRA